MFRWSWADLLALLVLGTLAGLLTQPVWAQTGAEIGGMLFVEKNNDGVYDPAWVETPVVNALVGLYLDVDATPGFSAGDSLVLTTTTTATGAYTFTLPSVSASDYIIRVEPSNWSAGGAILSGVSNNPVHVSSTYQAYPGTTTTPDPDASTVDADDNGLGLVNPALSGVYSPPFTVSNGITRSDIDFGFYRIDLVRTVPECRIAVPGQPTVFAFSPSNGLGFGLPVTITVQSGTVLGSVPTSYPFPSQLPGKFAYAPGRLNYVEPQAVRVSSSGLANVRTTVFNPYLNGGSLQSSQLNGNNQIPCAHNVFPDIEWRDNDDSQMTSLSRLDLSTYTLSLTGSAGGSGGCTYNGAQQRVCAHTNTNIANGAGGFYSNPGNTLSAMVPFSHTYTVTQSGLPAGCEVVRGADGVPHTQYTLSTLGFGGGNEADDYGRHGFYVGSDPLRRGATDGGRHPLPAVGHFDDFRTQVLHEVVNRCYLLRLGNRVWRDANNDGQFDPVTETGLATVQLDLLNGAGSVITTTTTDPQGRFAFTGLLAGDFRLRVVAGNFTPGGPLAGYVRSSPTALPNADQDSDDDGLNTATAITDGVVSSLITLNWLSEPVVDSSDEAGDYRDTDSNLTVDFGFAPAPQVSLDKALVGADTDLIAPNFITFTLDIGNTGQSTLDVIPLNDTYDPALLAFFSASIRPDDNFNDGTLTWSDLTQPGQRGIGRDLDPGQSVSITVVFRIAADISTSSNTASVSGATDTNGLVAPDVADSVVISDLPTSVELVDFSVSVVDGALITLTWTTAAEINADHFVLYRGRAWDGRDAVAVASRPAVGGLGGAAYSVTDVAPDRGPWWYWLADVDLRGNETRHGPLTAGTGPARNGPATIYLPFIRR